MKNKNGLRPVWQIILIDLLLAVMILGGWWFSKKAGIEIAARRFEKTLVSPSPATVETTSPPSVTLPDPVEQTPLLPDEPPVETDAPEPEIPDLRTELQKKFEDHFTDEIILTDNSYSSPNISITISSGTLGEGNDQSVYYVADIYLGNIDCFQSYFAHGLAYPSRTALMPQMVEETGALLAINGDYCGLNFGGIILRNGVSISSAANGSDICILFADGSIQCMNSREYRAEDYEDGSIRQIWCFGPAMMDGNGNVLAESEMNLPTYIAGYNPRTGIGYYEPGHYCFVVADGRNPGYSKGIYMGEFAGIFASLGCVQAFNLDGGGSTSMMFASDFINRPSTSGQRDMPDIILIKEIEPVSAESLS